MALNYALITMQETPERRKKFFLKNSCLDTLPIIEVGVNGNCLSAKEYYNYGVRANTIPMSPAEVGCSLSHIEAYKFMINNNIDYIIILEDDIEFLSGCSIEDLKKLSSIVKREDVMLLGGLEGLDAKNHLMGKVISNNPKVWSIPVPMHRWCWRTCSYIIGRNAAQRILNIQLDLMQKADNWRYFSNNTSLNIMYSPIFSHPNDVSESSIENERSKVEYTRSWFLRKNIVLLKRLYKAYWGFRLNLEVIHKN